MAFPLKSWTYAQNFEYIPKKFTDSLKEKPRVKIEMSALMQDTIC